MPSAAEIDVELCAAPNGSYSLSDLFVNPESPLPCLRVFILCQSIFYEDKFDVQHPK